LLFNRNAIYVLAEYVDRAEPSRIKGDKST
jgi:hypothetical protein